MRRTKRKIQSLLVRKKKAVDRKVREESRSSGRITEAGEIPLLHQSRRREDTSGVTEEEERRGEKQRNRESFDEFI